MELMQLIILLLNKLEKCDLNPRRLFGFLSFILYHLVMVVLVWKYKEGVLVELEKSTLVDRLQLEIVLTQATWVLPA
jgi:hypothetical protein